MTQANQIAVFDIEISPDHRGIGKSPWIFSNHVRHLNNDALDANRCALVRIKSASDYFGIYCKSGLFSIRMLTKELDLQQAVTNDNLITTFEFTKSISSYIKKLETRKIDCLGFESQESFRLVHGDSDGIPGIVIDNYRELLVISSSSAAGEFLMPFVAQGLIELYPTSGILERSTGQTRKQEGLEDRCRWIHIPQGRDESDFLECQCIFADRKMVFNPTRCQKTGLFLDQRENLRLLNCILGANPSARISRSDDKNSKSILDICSYAGAWSTVAASNGFTNFTLIDQDKNALALAEKNVRLNSEISQQISIESLNADLFESLSALGKGNRKFDVVVADPPAFAKSKQHVPEALRAYSRLFKLASNLVARSGILVACSCSRNITDQEFQELATKSLQGGDWIMRGRGYQAPDHTMGPGRGAAEYLKCYFFQKLG